MMESLLLILILIYVFGVGYFAVCKLDKFMRKNPQAFSGNKKIVVVPPLSWQNRIEDDRACNPWYNDCTYFEELESHEECNS